MSSKPGMTKVTSVLAGYACYNRKKARTASNCEHGSGGQVKFAIRGGLIFVSAAAGLYTAQPGELPTYTTGVLAFAALTAAERFGLPDRLRIALHAAQLLCAFWLTERFGPAMLFLSLSSLPGYLRSGTVPEGLLAAAHLLALNLALAGADVPTRVNANLAFLLSAGLLGLLGGSERSEREIRRRYDGLRLRHFELHEERERLAAFAARIEEEAQDEERVRIARKLHDDIGHRLIRIKMMMEAALHILPTERERAAAMLEQIRRQLEESMEEIRLSVKKGTTASRAEHEYALDRLLGETGEQAGIRTSYLIRGLPYALYPSYRVTLYQNAREALTNALRHGRADYVELTLIYEPDAVVTEIRSGRTDDADVQRLEAVQRADGAQRADDVPLQVPAAEFARQKRAEPERTKIRPGMGIRGMAERTRHLGGELRIEPGPPFTVVTRLPVRVHKAAE
ncbi:sensor histidine kinase [Saccharibacillus brassicae]|uniref:histidine kinase n=1 Tax=Saccharibacillus brassicae TaxID=2583377 RepID=A0A4Y6UXR1_SACBS|nr:sensor histidine kinase [Saccharibacillus brassicae]